jgi:hypothetical protein
VGQVNQSFTTEISMSSVNSVFFIFSDDPNECVVCKYLFMYCSFQ